MASGSATPRCPRSWSGVGLFWCATERVYSVFRSSCIVSCGSEVVGAFGGREDVDEAADGGPKALDGAFGGIAQESFQFGEGVLDGVEIGRVRREVEQACPRRLDQGS